MLIKICKCGRIKIRESWIKDSKKEKLNIAAEANKYEHTVCTFCERDAIVLALRSVGG